MASVPVGSLSLVMFAAACGGKGATQVPAVLAESASARTVAALLPPDAVIYARVTSLDALVATARAAVTAFGGDASGVSRDSLLANLGAMAGDTSQIDPSRTIGVALVAPKGTRPTPILFVPVKDGAKYAASLRTTGIEAVVEGDYAVLPLGGKYATPAAPSSLAQAMPAGLVAVRVDVAKTNANLGVLINSGLDVFERQMVAAFGDGGTGIDGEAMAELYVDFAKSVLEAGTTLDLVVDETGGRASVAATLTAKPGSDLDGWSSPPIDLSSFAGKLSGSTAVEVVAVADWATLWPKFEPMMATLLDIYPPAMREALHGMMQVYPSVYSRLGPVFVAGIDFSDGLRMQMHVAPPDAKALLAEVETLVKRPDFANLGMTITAGAPSDSGGAAVRDYLLTFDPSRMAAAAGEATDDEKLKAVQGQMTEAFQTMFGSDGIPMRLQVADGGGVISIGKIGSDPAKAAASTSGVWSADLQPALTLVSGCNPMFVERIDFAAMMRGMASSMPAAARGRMPLPAADLKAEFVVGGGVRGAEWRAFLLVDLAGMGAAMEAMTPR